MTRPLLVTPEGDAFLDGDLHDDTGILLETDMDWHDTLPAQVTPVPERREWSVKSWLVLS